LITPEIRRELFGAKAKDDDASMSCWSNRHMPLNEKEIETPAQNGRKKGVSAFLVYLLFTQHLGSRHFIAETITVQREKKFQSLLDSKVFLLLFILFNH
jgi:hypothetical protein